MMKKIIIAVLSFCAGGVWAQDMSAADFVEYDRERAVYTVTKTFEVAPDAALFIPAGHKVVFLPGTGIEVWGELIIDGRAGREVTFVPQSAAESGLGAPGDWAGITLHPGSKTYISHAVIAYAAVGLNSCCEDITLINTTFAANGVNFKIGGKTAKAENRQPIDYDASRVGEFIDMTPEEVEVLPAEETEPEVVAEKKEKKKKEPKPKKEPRVRTAAEKRAALKLTARLSAAAVTAGGIVGGIYCHNRAGREFNKYERYKLEGDADRAKSADNKVGVNNVWSGVWFTLGGIGASGFAVTFFF